jgi:hypothetical protein
MPQEHWPFGSASIHYPTAQLVLVAWELVAAYDALIQKCVFGEASRREMLAFLLAYKIVIRKRPEFPSGITSGARPTIQSWFIQRVWERRVARGDGDR